MSNPTSNYGWQMPTATDLVTDLPADFEVFGQAVDTALMDLKGGTSGQVLAKNSNTDMDFVWVAQDDSNAIQNAIVDAKGDLIAATAADTPARLPVGTNGQILVADSTASTGLKWATPVNGKVLQVINATTTTSTASTTSTYADTTLTASITPSASNSKVLVIVNQSWQTPANTNRIGIKLFRATTEIDAAGEYYGYAFASGEQFGGHISLTYLDSPNTTSATAYKTQFNNGGNSGTVRVNHLSMKSYITLMEIGA